jgi:hypothetical protein
MDFSASAATKDAARLRRRRFCTPPRFFSTLPHTYYVTDYYRPYPVVLVRLSHLDQDALRDLLSVSWRMALEKTRRSTRREGRSRAGRA